MTNEQKKQIAALVAQNPEATHDDLNFDLWDALYYDLVPEITTVGKDLASEMMDDSMFEIAEDFDYQNSEEHARLFAETSEGQLYNDPVFASLSEYTRHKRQCKAENL